jgi:hypothetical protein
MEPDPLIANLLSLSTARTRDDYIRLARFSAALGAARSRQEWGPRDQGELQALLTEYQSLRQESMNAITNRIQIVALGMAAIAAMAGASVTSQALSSNPALIRGVFSGAIPITCTFILLMWLSEAVRSHRVSYFLASAVEAAVNAKLGRLVMTWEAGLWTGLLPRDELWGPSMAALGVVGLLGAAAPWLGVVMTQTPVSMFRGRPLYEVWAPYALYLVVVVYCLRNMSRLRNNPIIVSRFLRGMDDVSPEPSAEAR